MTANPNSALADRVAKLEGENRAFRRVFAVLFALGTVLAVAGVGQPQASKKVVEAEELILRDKKGVERLRLVCDGSVAAIEVRDEKGELRARLGVTDDGVAPAALSLMGVTKLRRPCSIRTVTGVRT